MGQLSANGWQDDRALLTPPVLPSRVSAVQRVEARARRARRHALAARGTQDEGRDADAFVIYAHAGDSEAQEAAAQLLHALTLASPDCAQIEMAEPSCQSEACSIYFGQSKVVELLLGGERCGSGLRSELGHVLEHLCSPKGLAVSLVSPLSCLSPLFLCTSSSLPHVCAQSCVCVWAFGCVGVVI